MSTRRLWLIDAGYLYSMQGTVDTSFQLDYLLLRNKIEQDLSGPIWKAYYLNSTPGSPNESQESFYNWLRTAPPSGPGIVTKLYGLKEVKADRAYCDSCRKTVKLSCPRGSHRIYNRQQKGVDVGIATLALKHIDRYDTLILSSGDGDLLDSIEYVTERGKRFELVVYEEGVSTELQCRADAVHLINDFKGEITRSAS